MPSVEELIARRAQQQARRIRRRRLTILALVILVVAASTWGVLALKQWSADLGDAAGQRPPASASAPAPAGSPSGMSSPTAGPAESASLPSLAPSPSASSAPDASASAPPAYVVGGPAARPRIVHDEIDFNARRQAEMAAYSRAHYGSSDIRLRAKAIVLHYTCGSDYASAHAVFAANAPNMGVKPGVVAHFVIDKDGTIYQQLPLHYKGRHTVGLNHVAIGIECVQEYASGDAATVSRILGRRPQARALVKLIRWLMYRYHITLPNVIGHGMANASPYYKDLKGWRNDHIDWSQPQILRLRRLIKTQ